jgi:hypothetical protein
MRHKEIDPTLMQALLGVADPRPVQLRLHTEGRPQGTQCWRIDASHHVVW